VKRVFAAVLVVMAVVGMAVKPADTQSTTGAATLVLTSPRLPPRGTGPEGRSLTLGGLFYETAQGRIMLPASLVANGRAISTRWTAQANVDGRTVRLSINPQGANFDVGLKAEPATGIIGWGVTVRADADEYYTGLMERVVDGPQQASWAPGISAGLDLRGQKVEMLVKPTTSVYAPFYLSSRGYGVFVRGTWPGFFEFAASDRDHVRIEFEGPSFDLKIYTAEDPAAIVRAHALDSGPPFLPPKWIYSPWRWRDEHTQRATYYDGTPVTGPFNAEVMEDVLLMNAYGIPNGVYWIDRPWGPGRLGYDDFEIDANRLPNFAGMIRWLSERQTRVALWIAPFFQGRMEKEAIARGYTLAGQPPQPNNYPLADFTNPAATAYWQDGLAKLLKIGVAGYKLDRSEENIPDGGPYTVFDKRSIRENRNAYPGMYLKAAYDVASKFRGQDFFLMPRAAYTGSAKFGIFWGGDIGGTQEGLRASIVAVQRAAILGYPNWGSDTCGYNQQLMEQEVCARWLAFSAFTPIMEVGPTRNVGFWNLPREPSYDSTLIAIWRLYARLHQRLADYSYRLAREAHDTGMPIVRPLFLIDPKSQTAWTNWWTYLYGPDVLVAPIWEKRRREQQVYLPSGSRWRDGWHPDTVHAGGQTITVHAEVHQIPLFIRAGSNIDVGNLEQEYQQSVAIAAKKPDLRSADAAVKSWFDKATPAGRR
jgi:alpha-D-xyloside xylohydrolase